MPDFDVDFCIAGRDRVIEYVAQNYGRQAVSQIATFGTMAAKGAIRDVARVLGKSYGLADRISKWCQPNHLVLIWRLLLIWSRNLKISLPIHPTQTMMMRLKSGKWRLNLKVSHEIQVNTRVV